MTDPSRPDADATRYVESSLLVAALIEDDVEGLAALSSARRRVTSALTFAEATRAILRARVAGRLTEDRARAAIVTLRDVEQKCAVLPIDDAILERAGRPFPQEPVRTLDAIHLATIEAIGEFPPLLTVLTRDERIRENAVALGYAVA